MRISLDVQLDPSVVSYRRIEDAAWDAVDRVVDTRELHDITVISVEPVTSPAKTRTDVVGVEPVGDVDVTVTLEGSAFCVQELSRRWEESVR